MDIKELNVFLHLCQTKHFAKTAEAMHLTPSTLSRIIQRMEQEVGDLLFIRDNRKVELTTAGMKTREFAVSTLNEWQSLKSQLQSDQTVITGSLEIYCSVTAAYELLPELISRFKQAHPKTDIKVVTGNAARALDSIENGEADLAITAFQEGQSKKYFFQSLQEMPLRIIAPNDNSQLAIICQKAESNPNFVWSELPFVMPESGPIRQKFERWLKAMHIKPNIYASVSGHEALVSMVALGCGLSIAPQLVLDASPVKEKITVLKPNINPDPFDLGVCCLKSRRKEPIIDAFLTIYKSLSLHQS